MLNNDILNNDTERDLGSLRIVECDEIDDINEVSRNAKPYITPKSSGNAADAAKNEGFDF